MQILIWKLPKLSAQGAGMNDLEIIQLVMGKDRYISDALLEELFMICKLVREEYREALDKMNEQAQQNGEEL